ncbi:MAG TPA: aminoacetone oxidase family FAD-binding enzyme [Holophagaceae bacterium]|nr:aminoacetone oxidase family FAD-binding enzyme [Holophagaceae bacterium]
MRVLIIGGGAAGMVAAWKAASAGHRVILLEANGKLGVKLRISGGGKCNITHDGPVKEVLGAFSKEQARFLRPSVHRFTNADVIALLRREGVETYTRDNGRVFPADRPGSAAAVVAAFQALVERAGVDVRFKARVIEVEGRAPTLKGVHLEDGTRLEAEAVILACGGASYPETGTRGEALGWLKALGLPVRPWFPALAPVPLKRPRPEWEGVALRDGRLWLRAGAEGKRLGDFSGDLVFTREGISGPAALELSQAAEAARRAGAAWLGYASVTGTPEAVDLALQAEMKENPQLKAITWLQRYLPERLCEPLVLAGGMPADQRLKDLPKVGRRAMVAAVTELPLGEPGSVNLARGEVAAGGLKLEGVDPQTMRVKGFENLWACGEVLDIDGPVGGYNLQAAFSTGYVAGELG